MFPKKSVQTFRGSKGYRPTVTVSTEELIIDGQAVAVYETTPLSARDQQLLDTLRKVYE